MGDPIWQWGAARTAAAIRAGEVSAAEVCEAHLERLEAANPAVNAVVRALPDEARAQAAAVDAARAAGLALGPLAGVPVTIKVNVDLKGHPNSNGVPAMANLIAPEDSPVARNLRRAGAVVLGQTNTPEFSMRAHTVNPLYGETLNPWDAAASCGGSSGGAGAATALGIGCIGHGNDIGGSLRIPALCNGIATVKPTQGRIPAFNPSGAAERPMIAQMMSTQGPLARSVADVRLGLAAMAARDARDPFQVPAPLEGPAVARRVAVARHPAGYEVHPEVAAAVRRAADALADAGWEVTEVETPDIAGAWACWADLLINEMDAMAGEAMLAATGEEFHRVWDSYRAFSRRLDLKGYLSAMAERATRLRAWLAFLEDWPVLLTPASLAPLFDRGADAVSAEATKRLFSHDLCWIAIFNMLGLPGAVVPVGMAGGRPTGVQLVASRYREDVALAAAEAVEARVGPLVPQLWARG